MFLSRPRNMKSCLWPFSGKELSSWKEELSSRLSAHTVIILCRLKCNCSFPVWYLDSKVSDFSSILIHYEIPLYCLNGQPVLGRQHKYIPAVFFLFYFFFQLLTRCHNTAHCSSYKYLQTRVKSYIWAKLKDKQWSGTDTIRSHILPSSFCGHTLVQ